METKTPNGIEILKGFKKHNKSWENLVSLWFFWKSQLWELNK